MMFRQLLHGRAGLALTASALLVCRDAGPTRLVLRPGFSLSSCVTAGAVRSFSLPLRRDQYLALRVTQGPVDVELTLRSPDGKAWPALDTQAAVPVPELLRVVAPRDGRYLLDVRAIDGTHGSFRVEVVELRPAALRDRLAAEAQEQLARAEELRRLRQPASDLRALPLYEAMVRLLAQAADADGEGYARVQWARVLKSLNRTVEEVAALRGCLALPGAAQIPGVRAQADMMLAEALPALGEDAAADAAGREALELWKRLGQIPHEVSVINELASRASERGELALAESLYLQALALSEARRPVAESAVAVVLGNLAELYHLAGEPKSALDMAERGLARLSTGSKPDDLAWVLAQKGMALADLGREEESRSAFSGALQLCRGGSTELGSLLQRRLARRAYQQGNFAEAAQRYRSALATLEGMQKHRSALVTRQDLAWTELKRGHLEAAEKLFRQIAAAAGASENGWLRPAVLAGRSQLERARGHLRPALALARQALDEAERLRRGLGRIDLKTSVFADQRSYFDLAADLTLALHDQTRDPSLLTEAFEISERSRSRRLLDLLETAPPPSAAPMDPAVPRAAKVLSRAGERLEAIRSAGAATSEIEGAEREVRKDVLDLRRQEGAPGPAPPSFGATPLSFDRIQRWLDPDTVLLELDLGDEVSYLWVVSRRHLAVHPLPCRREIELRARKAMSVLSAQGSSADSPRAHETLLALAHLLLDDAMPELAAHRWLLVMDGALHALPLGALPDPGHPEQPILATHEIAYAPSASVAVRLAERAERQRRRGDGPRGELAVFADAVYELGSAEAAGPAAGEIAPVLGPLGVLRSVAGPSRLSPPRLIHSNEEAKRILELVPPAARLDARRFDATKARALSGVLAGYLRLHFAVHGLPDESHPELSGLELSVVDRQGRPQEGILFAHEIARLHLPAELAVLSSCQSARGAEISGEGLVGLAHAFFTAGTARVVASQWAVDDQATAELMGLFYEGLLRRHLPPARALQAAQLALAGDARWHRPYYWAAFVVQGGF
jgi:CHAT domain-containing protein